MATQNLQVVCLALANLLQQKRWMLATAESCTGGMVAAACTDLAGSSVWFERGLVCYSNAAKTELLGVDPALIAQHGAVSDAVARAMAQGVLQRTPAQVALAVTGVAGPGGGRDAKPVGTVWFGWALPGHTWTAQHHFPGDRAAVRHAATLHALTLLEQRLRALL